MKLSWRSLHYFFALIAGIFILLASGTGLILAVEPWVHSMYAVSGEAEDGLTFASFKEKLDEQFIEVFSLEKDVYGNIRVEGIGMEDEGTFYVNTSTAEVISPPKEIAAVFHFSRDLHRSLFLKTPGRIIMGLVSLFMVFLTVSGIALLIKRGGGVKALFKSMTVLDYVRDGHASWGRFFLIPVFIISLSGVYLSADRFVELREKKNGNSHKDASSYETVLLSEVKAVTFPVIEEDPLVVELADGTSSFDPESGKLLDFDPKTLAEKMYRLSFVLHTGEGSPSWALILGISAIVMLFLSFTGFQMVVGKRRKSKKQTGKIEDYIILVGSETGHTWRFAEALQNALKVEGTASSLLGMNELSKLEGGKTLIFMASTYGDGDAPENAAAFLDKLEVSLDSDERFRFCILGFGSSEYEAFCAYAEKLRNHLQNIPGADEFVPYMTVDNRSAALFMDWVKELNKSQGSDLRIDVSRLKPSRRKQLNSFEVLDKREEGELFLLRLKILTASSILSGDLLGVYPPGEDIERFYSIAVDEKSTDILLVIKKTGLCSCFLGNFKTGDKVEGFIKKNPSFYMPETNKVLLISNGTGIAPFLGMQNERSLLYWGGRYRRDLDLLNGMLERENFISCFSREETSDRKYVQDILMENKTAVSRLVQEGGTIMICGSMAMLGGVTEVLKQLLQEANLPSTDVLKKEGRLRIDCY
jgi:sulfite reductase (NADPH) flavoprotein alpha-component